MAHFGEKFKKERKHKINNEVRFPQVRIVGDGESRIMSSLEAYREAESMGLDLILINENQEPPIVKLADYSKFIYEIKKSEKLRKKNAHQIETKEIQLSCEIGEHDLITKSKKAKEFLNKSDKVKTIIQLKGRQNSMPERGELVLLKFADLLKEDGIPENLPVLEGNKLTMTLKPKKT